MFILDKAKQIFGLYIVFNCSFFNNQPVQRGKEIKGRNIKISESNGGSGKGYRYISVQIGGRAIY